MKTRNTVNARLARFAMKCALLCIALVCGSWAGLIDSAHAATLVVTNTNDTGAGSLRQAILDANSNGSAVTDTISFNIPGGGVKTIKPASALPDIMTPVVIDGYTQPGTSANTLAIGNNAVLLIELDGSSAGANVHGLSLKAPNSTIKGLVINRFASDFHSGIAVFTTTNSKIEGNFLGTNASGTAALANNIGVSFGGNGSLATNCTVGGMSAGARNVISGNTRYGVSFVGSGVTDNAVQGNYIGTDATGTTALANKEGGVILQIASKNTIGGTTVAARNVISANTAFGIAFTSNASNNFVQGNYIGTQANGTNTLGSSSSSGVAIDSSSGNTIGGTVSGAGNVIAHNGFKGVYVLESASTGNSILSNSIFSNGQAIDLGLNGLTANDNGDGDTGPNNLQNFPVLSGATLGNGALAVAGMLNSAPNASFRIEYFLNDACHAAGNGEGKTFVGAQTVQTDANGNASVAASLPTNASGAVVTATATDAANNTSEFSACAGVNAQQTPPSVSINDISFAEGNSGTTNATFTVTLSKASAETITVKYDAQQGTAKFNEDFSPVPNTMLTFAPGETSKQAIVLVNGDTKAEPDENFFVHLFDLTNATFTDDVGKATILNDDATLATSIEFDKTEYVVEEGSTKVTLTVTRNGDASGASTVKYETGTGGAFANVATERTDYTTALGTLTFAPGETSKTFDVLINEDSNVEGDETLSVELTGATGGGVGEKAFTQIKITEDSSEPSQNAADDAEMFVRQHYHDFLNREADAAGLSFWTGELSSCGADAACLSRKRQQVSAAFFLSIEFQQTGFFVHRLSEASFDRLPRYREFVRDTQEVARGIVVGQGTWEQKLEANRQAFVEAWAQRTEFKQKYDAMSNAQYVDTLFQNAGVVPQAVEKQALVSALDAQTDTRAGVLRKVADSGPVMQLETNRAFVLMQYFGYLRRNADDAPDGNMDGYNFWLSKLDAFGGDFQKAQMVKAFLVSMEYRSRFGQP